MPAVAGLGVAGEGAGADGVGPKSIVVPAVPESAPGACGVCVVGCGACVLGDNTGVGVVCKAGTVVDIASICGGALVSVEPARSPGVAEPGKNCVPSEKDRTTPGWAPIPPAPGTVRVEFEGVFGWAG